MVGSLEGVFALTVLVGVGYGGAFGSAPPVVVRFYFILLLFLISILYLLYFIEFSVWDREFWEALGFLSMGTFLYPNETPKILPC
jgi:hypothetical protein